MVSYSLCLPIYGEGGAKRRVGRFSKTIETVILLRYPTRRAHPRDTVPTPLRGAVEGKIR
jgi:hypothetical protein